jgi:hypothetical protein
MNSEIAVAVLVALLGGAGIGSPIAWVVGRKQRHATVTALELENDKKAIGLYESMINISQDLQNRLNSALDEHDDMRVALNDCLVAREQARRNNEARELQAKIDKAAWAAEAAALRHEIADLRLTIATNGAVT